jgi:hypothetical protein
VRAGFEPGVLCLAHASPSVLPDRGEMKRNESCFLQDTNREKALAMIARHGLGASGLELLACGSGSRNAQWTRSRY